MVANHREDGSEVSATVVQSRLRRVRAYRTAHRLSAAAFARRLGVSEASIQSIVAERRERFAADRRERLLAIINVSRDEWYREDP